MLIRVPIICFTLLLVCIVAVTYPVVVNSDGAGTRIAFVVGNSNYEEISSLDNPKNDANDVAERLRALGFDLHGDKVHLDLDERSFLREYNRFARAADRKDMAFLFFAGHGMQFDGEPHLLPVDVADDELDIVKRRAISLNDLLSKVDGKAKLSIAVFDACREIPDLREQVSQVTRGGSDAGWRGLSRPQITTSSTLIAYSGGSGELVADGAGRNSPYTTVLLEYLDTDALVDNRLDVPGTFSEISYIFRERHRGQRPEVINQGVRPNRHFFLSHDQRQQIITGRQTELAVNKATIPGPMHAAYLDALAWQSAERGGLAADYRLYLDQFPEGLFADFANVRLEGLGDASSAANSGGRDQSVAKLQSAQQFAATSPDNGAQAVIRKATDDVLTLQNEPELRRNLTRSLEVAGVIDPHDPVSHSLHDNDSLLALFNSWQVREGRAKTEGIKRDDAAVLMCSSGFATSCEVLCAGGQANACTQLGLLHQP